MPLWKRASGTRPSHEPRIERFGMEILRDCEDPYIDIIFVHGLTGDRQTTWSCGDICWPLHLLPSDLPHARVLTYGYDADVASLLRTVGDSNLRDHGKALAAQTAAFRRDAEWPMVFVAHSLGGLVVQQAFLICLHSDKQKLRRLSNETRGIIFMGTPHQGSELANWGTLAARLTEVFAPVNSRVVGDLRPHSEALEAVTEQFQQLVRPGNQTTSVVCLYETNPMPILKDRVVPKPSAILKQWPNFPIAGNHSEITKFASQRDSGYKTVLDILKDWHIPPTPNPAAPTPAAPTPAAPNLAAPAAPAEPPSEEADGVGPARGNATPPNEPEPEPEPARRRSSRGQPRAGKQVHYSGTIHAMQVNQGSQTAKRDLIMNFGYPPPKP